MHYHIHNIFCSLTALQCVLPSSFVCDFYAVTVCFSVLNALSYSVIMRLLMLSLSAVTVTCCTASCSDSAFTHTVLVCAPVVMVILYLIVVLFKVYFTDCNRMTSLMFAMVSLYPTAYKPFVPVPISK